jgi:hypothetical protein
MAEMRLAQANKAREYFGIQKLTRRKFGEKKKTNKRKLRAQALLQTQVKVEN